MYIYTFKRGSARNRESSPSRATRAQGRRPSVGPTALPPLGAARSFSIVAPRTRANSYGNPSPLFIHLPPMALTPLKSILKSFFGVPTFNFLNVGTVPTWCILYVGTVPMRCILNVGTVPTFNHFQNKMCPCTHTFGMEYTHQYIHHELLLPKGHIPVQLYVGALILLLAFWVPGQEDVCVARIW